MSPDLQKLLTGFLQRRDRKRAALAARLIDSLHVATDLAIRSDRSRVLSLVMAPGEAVPGKVGTSITGSSALIGFNSAWSIHRICLCCCRNGDRAAMTARRT